LTGIQIITLSKLSVVEEVGVEVITQTEMAEAAEATA
jgi:hypothetical protein